MQGANTITFQGITYTPRGMKMDGLQKVTKGVLPRPTMNISNVDGYISSLCRQYNDMVGAIITRKRTLYEFLDGQPGADSTQEYPQEIFVVDRKAGETNTICQFELATKADSEGVTIPFRQILANACQWIYRGPDCGYAGPAVADVNDVELGAQFTDGVSTLANGLSDQLVSATAAFTNADVGKTIVAPLGVYPVATMIAVRINATTVQLSNYALSAATGVTFKIVGRVVDRAAYSVATTYAAGDSAYTVVTDSYGNQTRMYWYSLVNGNTGALTDPTKWTLDRCGKKLYSCKLRWGGANPLPTSAFPGCQKIPA